MTDYQLFSSKSIYHHQTSLLTRLCNFPPHLADKFPGSAADVHRSKLSKHPSPTASEPDWLQSSWTSPSSFANSRLFDASNRTHFRRVHRWIKIPRSTSGDFTRKEEKKSAKNLSSISYAIYYHENRRETEKDDRLYGNRVGLPIESDLSVAAKKSTLHVAHRKFNENENGRSCGMKQTTTSYQFRRFLRPLTHIDLPRRNINRSTVTDKARASWKHGGFPFGFMTLLMCW